MGEKYYQSPTAGYLAASLMQQGRDDEAEEFTTIDEHLAANDDISSQVLWRSVRGRELARSGRLDEAEVLTAIVTTEGSPAALEGIRNRLVWKGMAEPAPFWQNMTTHSTGMTAANAILALALVTFFVTGASLLVSTVDGLMELRRPPRSLRLSGSEAER